MADHGEEADYGVTRTPELRRRVIVTTPRSDVPLHNAASYSNAKMRSQSSFILTTTYPCSANCGPRRSDVPPSVDADAAHAIGWPHDGRAAIAVGAMCDDRAARSGASGPINATGADNRIGF
jgi:hypothetical protein